MFSSLLSTIVYIVKFGLTSDGNTHLETYLLDTQKAYPILTQDLPQNLIYDGILIRHLTHGNNPVRRGGFH